MRHYIYGFLIGLLLMSLTGCAVPQKKSYYIQLKTTTLHCPVGSVYRADGWCHYPTPGFVEKPLYVPKPKSKSKKKVQPRATITCKEVFKKINQCMGN